MSGASDFRPRIGSLSQRKHLFLPDAVAPADATGSPLPPAPAGAPLPIEEVEPGVATPDNIRVFPAPSSTTDASMQLARQVARLLAEARQQIHAAARESAAQAVNSERRLAFEQWEQKMSTFREDLARETTQALGTIHQETEAGARTAQAAAAESLKDELPKWLVAALGTVNSRIHLHNSPRKARPSASSTKSSCPALRNHCRPCVRRPMKPAAKLRTQAELLETQVSGSPRSVGEQRAGDGPSARGIGRLLSRDAERSDHGHAAASTLRRRTKRKPPYANT